MGRFREVVVDAGVKRVEERERKRRNREEEGRRWIKSPTYRRCFSETFDPHGSKSKSGLIIQLNDSVCDVSLRSQRTGHGYIFHWQRRICPVFRFTSLAPPRFRPSEISDTVPVTQTLGWNNAQSIRPKAICLQPPAKMLDLSWRGQDSSCQRGRSQNCCQKKCKICSSQTFYFGLTCLDTKLLQIWATLKQILLFFIFDPFIPIRIRKKNRAKNI